MSFWGTVHHPTGLSEGRGGPLGGARHRCILLPVLGISGLLRDMQRAGDGVGGRLRGAELSCHWRANLGGTSSVLGVPGVPAASPLVCFTQRGPGICPWAVTPGRGCPCQRGPGSQGAGQPVPWLGGDCSPLRLTPSSPTGPLVPEPCLLEVALPALPLPIVSSCLRWPLSLL